jgi:hypothetical protein
MADPSSERLHRHQDSTVCAVGRTIALKGFVPRVSAGTAPRKGPRAREGWLGRGQPGPVAPRVRAGAAVTRTQWAPRASRLVWMFHGLMDAVDDAVAPSLGHIA